MSNDRFKFRVPYRCFECNALYFDYLEWNGWNFTHIEADICCHKDAQSEKLSEAEQCTGLKDKMDSLCWEGDIRKIHLPMGGFWGNVKKEKIAEIKWDDDRACFIAEWEYSKNQHHVIFDCDIALESEFIGTIHDTTHSGGEG